MCAYFSGSRLCSSCARRFSRTGPLQSQSTTRADCALGLGQEKDKHETRRGEDELDPKELDESGLHILRNGAPIASRDTSP